jgi:hypothetical protein
MVIPIANYAIESLLSHNHPRDTTINPATHSYQYGWFFYHNTHYTNTERFPPQDVKQLYAVYGWLRQKGLHVKVAIF